MSELKRQRRSVEGGEKGLQFDLTIRFSFDPASGLFYGTLENGARFAIDRRNLGGRLAENLDLFKGAVLRELKGEDPIPPLPRAASGDAALIAQAIEQGRVKKLDKRGLPKLYLEDLNLDLGDLEL